MKGTKGKRLFAFLIVLVALFSASVSAFAHIPCMCDNPPDKCTCFIQLGDKGLAVEKIIQRLKAKGYLKKIKKKKEFTPDVKEAVLKFQADHGLERTGWMDDETLDALLSDVLPGKGVKLSSLYRDGIYYVPTDGGIRFHSDPTCSGMYHPRMISGTNARLLGLEHCGKESCIKHSVLSYASLGLTPRILPDEYYETEEESVQAALLPVRSVPSDEVERVYIGNKKSHIFHVASCKSAKKMSDKNKVEFSSREEAIGKGYRPCQNCNP